MKTYIQRGRYYDSIHLMQVARELTNMPGVLDAAVVMATEANKSILRQSGLLTAEAETSRPDDLVVVFKAGEEITEQVLAAIEKLLNVKTRKQDAGESIGYHYRTVHAARLINPQANVAVISVAGRYATAEAWEALYSGLHVLLFSDNVSLEDEIALKQYACKAGLLMMGPGAGTALINGIGLGFANRVPSGPVGIVSAAGTGLQEVSSLLAKYGTGVSQGIGTGGRDLNESVGGLMMLAGLKSLQEDPGTGVIILVSKPPAPGIAHKVIEAAALSSKPTIICFLGGSQNVTAGFPNIRTACTLQEAAYIGSTAAGISLPHFQEMLDKEAMAHEEFVKERGLKLKPGQHYLRGLFSGGTLCFEAQVIWKHLLKTPIFSNAPLQGQNKLSESAVSFEHTILDLGEEEFTVGRPHPMIDYDLRCRRLLQEAADPQVAVVIMDVVLGYGSHPDPASELGPAVNKAHQLAHQDGREICIITSLTGTDEDPQGYEAQSQVLKRHGVIVCDCNASAARLAGRVVNAH